MTPRINSKYRGFDIFVSQWTGKWIINYVKAPDKSVAFTQFLKLTFSTQEAAEKSARSYIDMVLQAPEGKTCIRMILKTDNDPYWCELRENDPHRYEQEKERVAGCVIDILERRLAECRRALSGGPES